LGITARDNCEEQGSDQIQFEIPSIYHVYIFPNLIRIMCVSFSALILLMDYTKHQGREFIANGALENGAFCTVFSENFHKF
jgi:hypothetical protein